MINPVKRIADSKYGRIIVLLIIFMCDEVCNSIIQKIWIMDDISMLLSI